jgi:hypothetical protein
VDEPKEVLFKIGIRSETVDTVKLYETDEDGQIQLEVGVCKDDGILPDEIYADGIYTAKKSLHSSEAGYLCYRVGVTETDGDSYYSETRCVWVTSHYKNVDIEEAVHFSTVAEEIYDRAINGGESLQEAAETVIEQLKDDPKIVDIGATAGGGVGWITDAGILGGYHPIEYEERILEDSASAQVNEIGAEARKSEKHLSTEGEGYQFPSPQGNTPLAVSAADNEEGNEVKSNKAIIISPYIKSFSKRDNYYTTWPAIQNTTSCKLYAAKEELNNATPEWDFTKFKEIVKTLSDYGYIHLCSHGIPYRSSVLSLWKEVWGNGKIHVGWGDVALYTNTYIPKKPDGSYDLTGFEEDLKQKRIAIHNKGNIAILPPFIRGYVKNLPNSIVALSACFSMYSDTMADAFIGVGAGAVVGFEMCAATAHTGPFTKTIIEELYKDKTIKEAFDYANTTHTYTNARLEGNEELRLSGKLKNAGFEDGVLTPWLKAGDGRVITRLGNTKPTEGSWIDSYMAIISTGLGYTTAAGSIHQDFCLASGAKTLSFDWNFFSEEFTEYCGSQYQDSFAVKMYALNLSTGKIESEQELFSKKIDDLCGMVHESDVTFDKSAGDCTPTGSNDCKVWSTGWKKNETVDISAFAGKAVTLRFSATDVGDSQFDSAILIDNISISLSP